MANRSRLRKLTLLILLVMMFFYPVLFRLDYANSTYERFDIVEMVSPYAWLLLVALCGFLALDVIISKKFGLFHLFVSALLVYGLFVATQYSVTLRYDDWVHDDGCRQITEQGTFLGGNSYARSWPGAFVAWATLNIVTSVGLVQANMLLTLVAIGLSVIFLHSLGKDFVGPQWAGLPGLIYLVSDAYAYQFLDRNRFTPFNIASLFSLMLLFVLMRLLRAKGAMSKNYCLVTLTCIAVITISHVLVPLYFAIVLIALFLVAKLFHTQLASSERLANALLLGGVFWLAWWINNSINTFSSAIALIGSIFNSQGRLKIVGTLRPSDSSINLATFLSSYYFRAIVLGTCLLSLLALMKIRKDKSFSLLLGIVMGSMGFALLTSLAPTEQTNIQWGRILPLSLFPIALCVSLYLVRTRSRARFSAIVLIFLIVPTFLTSFSFLSVYVEATHQWEISGFEFLSSRTTKPIFLESDKFIAISYGSYFDTKKLAVTSELYLERVNYTYRLQTYPNFFRGDTIIRSLKQKLAWNPYVGSKEETAKFWDELDYRLSNNSLLNRLYDNRNMQTYKKH